MISENWYKCNHMSKGPGTVEKRITELFAATRDRALSVADVAERAFELAGKAATREQRLSATRAAHRLVRRIKEIDNQARKLGRERRGDDIGLLAAEPGVVAGVSESQHVAKGMVPKRDFRAFRPPRAGACQCEASYPTLRKNIECFPEQGCR
jgi:hypothetical protein